VERDTKHTLIAIGAVAAVIGVVFLALFASSGYHLPQTTVVESQSMQHGKGSQIGTIDTADMIILKNKDMIAVQSFVDGYQTGYQTFGSYGNVVVYSRGEDQNPIIHRLILWLDYNEDGTWSAPSLAGYPKELWSAASGEDYNRLSGVFHMKNMGYNGNVDATLDLNRLKDIYPHSGFITMGDYNTIFDQPSNVSGVKGLVTEENIKSVAWIEIPWVGVFRMYMNDKMNTVNEMVPNTVPSLIASIFMVVFLLIGISFMLDRLYYKKYRKNLIEEMNAPTPLFPVEREK